MQFFYIFDVAVIMCLIAAYIIFTRQYKKTAYYQVTGNSYLSMRFNLGKFGEYLTYKYLRSYEAQGAKFLFNCYLPRENGETTEIDVLMICRSGLYVFESKNYSGWIFGNEKGKTWTQTLPQGRKSHKEHFLNPIMQNKLHIKWLKNLIQDESIPVYSVIVFSERCSLKKIDIYSSDVAVIKRDSMLKTVAKIDSDAGSILEQDKVLKVYKRLFPYTQVSAEIRQKHIDSINSQIRQKVQGEDVKKSDVVSSAAAFSEKKDQLRCPRCGSLLVLRTAKKGSNAGRGFYGCSAYPKCKYIKNVRQTV